LHHHSERIYQPPPVGEITFQVLTKVPELLKFADMKPVHAKMSDEMKEILKKVKK